MFENSRLTVYPLTLVKFPRRLEGVSGSATSTSHNGYVYFSAVP